MPKGMSPAATVRTSARLNTGPAGTASSLHVPRCEPARVLQSWLELMSCQVSKRSEDLPDRIFEGESVGHLDTWTTDASRNRTS
jgi:hypothetical protein